jgi:hypothetical protein
MVCRNRGFLLIDTLIAGLIITSSIAATMLLFRVGFENLQRANSYNALSSKVTPATNILKGLDLSTGGGVEELGEGFSMKWNAQVIAQTDHGIRDDGPAQLSHELILYQVDFAILSANVSRDYEVRILKGKKIASEPG